MHQPNNRKSYFQLCPPSKTVELISSAFTVLDPPANQQPCLPSNQPMMSPSYPTPTIYQPSQHVRVPVPVLVSFLSSGQPPISLQSQLILISTWLSKNLFVICPVIHQPALSHLVYYLLGTASVVFAISSVVNQLFLAISALPVTYCCMSSALPLPEWF